MYRLFSSTSLFLKNLYHTVRITACAYLLKARYRGGSRIFLGGHLRGGGGPPRSAPEVRPWM